MFTNKLALDVTEGIPMAITKFNKNHEDKIAFAASGASGFLSDPQSRFEFSAFLIQQLHEATTTKLRVLILTAIKILLRFPASDPSVSSLRSDIAISHYQKSISNTSNNNLLFAGLTTLTNLYASTPQLKNNLLIFKQLLSIFSSSCSLAATYRVSRLIHLLVGTVPDLLNFALQSEVVVISGATLSYLARIIKFSTISNPDIFLCTTELLRMLYAIGNSTPGRVYMRDPANGALLTQIGFLTGEILHLNNSDSQIYEVKIELVKVLMCELPDDFGSYLLANGNVDDLLRVLEIQCDRVVVEGTLSSESVATLAILAVLAEFVKKNDAIRAHCKAAIFCGMDGKEEEGKPNENENGIVLTKKEQKMAPKNAPVGTLRYKVIKLMTSIDTNVKRYSSELMWDLCGGVADEFVENVGFGNGVHFMGIKGLVNTPK
ncbi:hypothetical protein ScalyP_jg4772 [Parmales sp. scaly parma]|nr:hypothetical protein ScalyP_jg4772 [Parmales sp. scaly parma]